MVVVIVAIVYARCYLLSVWNVHGESEKNKTKKLLPITPQILTDFKKKIFADRLSSKFATNLYLHIPPHLKYVATLPC